MAHKHDCVTLVTSFITWVIDRIKLVHQYNHTKPAPEPIEGSYYPPGGTAYYFTESGQQLRKLPKYDCDSGNKHTNYDEANIVDRQCNKDFPSVMFLWFCGQHGHCYGFHLISGGEGQKDPFCSLYKYMKDMPKDVFYDFACNLSEYDLFFPTRFWHDLFHSITHLCGPNFKTG